MKAVLLAAGLGTRLRPLTDSLPKCLAPICGTPLLSLWLDQLLSSDAVDRVLVNTHHLSDQVISYVRGSRWTDKVDLVFEPKLLGTGGTLLKNYSWVGREPVLVAHADNLTLFNINDFISAHENRPQNCLITMMTFDTDTPQSCGIVEIERGVVVHFHEKVPNPPGTRANAAVYIFEPEVIEFIRRQGKDVVDISTEVLANFLGRIFVHHNAIYHRDIGTVESLQIANEEFLSYQIKFSKN